MRGKRLEGAKGKIQYLYCCKVPFDAADCELTYFGIRSAACMSP